MGSIKNIEKIAHAAFILLIIIVLMFLSTSSAFSLREYDQHELLGRRVCDEIYVVGEGETLHSISDKCGDPFIIEQNPHIHDPDDVFPGLIIKITTTTTPSASTS
ncbi:hypothetical protein ACH5RR_023982 [Cinchona calisaya]|uniref:LysM domain-containing protein n=1 Tax=Cinchona calisaya TaxID=153742 RepID=A0ABD2ZFM3_9GENT